MAYTSVRCTLSFKLILHYVESIVWETPPPLVETTKESRVADNDTTVIHIPSLK